MSAYIYFAVTTVFALFLLYVLFGRSRNILEAQLVANRRVPYPFIGVWMAVAFTWGATFFYAGQLAYTSGILGLTFYLIGNGGGLALALWLAPRIPVPDQKYSIVEVMNERYSKRTGWLYSLGIMGVQAGYALTLQFLAAAALLGFTIGANSTYTIIAAAAAMIIPVMLGGIRSSAAFDIIKGSMMAVLILVLAPLAVIKAGGFSAVSAGLMGHVADAASAATSTGWGFVLATGIPVIVSLISAGPIDQALFQRYFSVTRGPVRAVRIALLAGLVFFVLNIVAAGTLGFLAANPALGIHVETARIAGFAAMDALLPGAAFLFIVTVIAAFVASGDTALNASSSVWAMDVYKQWWNPEASPEQVVRVQRYAMLVFILIAMGIALLGIDMLTLTIAVGVFRSALFVPTIVAFLARKELVPDLFGAMLAAMAASVVLYGTGTYCGARECASLPLFEPSMYQFLGSLSGWCITGAYCLWLLLRNRIRASVA